MLGTLARDAMKRNDGRPVRFLQYGDTELSYLRGRDGKLAEIIDKTGIIDEYVDPNLYTALVRNIIGQQITIPLYERTWAEFQKVYGVVPDPAKVIDSGLDRIRSLGIPAKRAEYILGISRGIVDHSIDPHAVDAMGDEDAMGYLTSIKGVGPWTAEMVLLFYYQRKNVFSFGDIALLRGIRMLYGLEEIDRDTFEGFRRRFSPYCSIASIYLWEVGEGRFPGYEDPRKKKKTTESTPRIKKKNQRTPSRICMFCGF